MSTATQIIAPVTDPETVPLPTLREMAQQELPKTVTDFFWQIEQNNEQRDRKVVLSWKKLAGLCNWDDQLTNLAIAFAQREFEFNVL